MSKKTVYLDYNATTPVLPDVIATYQSTLSNYGNPSSFHSVGRESKNQVEDARQLVANAISASSSQVIFTSSGTEGNNHILQSIWQQHILEEKPVHIITSTIEHSSIVNTLRRLALFGVSITAVPVTGRGYVDVSQIQSEITPNTRLISVMLANNEVGSIQPVSDICRIAHSAGVLVHTDAVQAFGKIPISVHDIPVDFMTLSAHKVYAPKGSGALYVRDDHQLSSLLLGGGHERNLRAGTENTSGISAFGQAVSQLSGLDEWKRQSELLDSTLIQLRNAYPDLIVHSDHHQGIPNTLNIGLKGVDGYELAMNLDLAGICVSTGSACSTGSVEPSPVLESMGISDAINRSSIRISIGRFTTQSDMDFFVSHYCDSVDRLRDG